MHGAYNVKKDNNVTVLATKHKTNGSQRLGLPKESCSSQMQTSLV